MDTHEIKFLEERLRENPDSILFARLADRYLENGQVEEALKVCEDGIKRHPYYVTGHFVMGKCLLKKAQFDQAEKEFKRVLLFDPKYLKALKYYADLMKNVGWDNAFESHYKKILAIDPFDEETKRGLEEFLTQKEKERPREEQLAEPFDIGEVEEEAIITDRTVELKEPFLEEETEPALETEAAGAEMEEDKFASILDDIFREEVAGEEEETKEESGKEFDFAQLGKESQLETKYTPPQPIVKAEEKKPEKVVRPEPKPEPPKDLEISEKPEAGEESSELQEQKKRKEKIVTPTLGEIYAAQGQYAKAIGVFEILKKKEPDNRAYQEKIEYLKKKLEESRLAE